MWGWRQSRRLVIVVVAVVSSPKSSADAFVLQNGRGTRAVVTTGRISATQRRRRSFSPIHLVAPRPTSLFYDQWKDSAHVSVVVPVLQSRRLARTVCRARTDDEEEKEKNDDEGVEEGSIGENLPSLKNALFRLVQSALVFTMETSAWRPMVRTAVVTFVLGCTVTLGLTSTSSLKFLAGAASAPTTETNVKPTQLFATVLDYLEERYVDVVNPQSLLETALQGMLQTLDPYTEFEASSQTITESVEGGNYGGVGLVISGTSREQQQLLLQQKQQQQVQQEDKNVKSDDEDLTKSLLSPESPAAAKPKRTPIKVISAFEGYAFDAGMRIGDEIVAIDGTRIDNGDDASNVVSVEDVRNKLRGEAGTTVQVTFRREGVDGENSLTLSRQIVRIHDVKLASLIEPDIGYVYLGGFSSNAGAEVRSSIRFLQQHAAEGHLKALLLDLRGNPGGLLESAVDVASAFVPEGSTIVSARGRGFPSVTYKSVGPPILNPHESRLVVLVNRSTASAAEIVSGAIQDLDVGVIVGEERTFGKGLVQSVQSMPYGTALKYTVAKYYTPSGRCIQSTNYGNGNGGGQGEDTAAPRRLQSSEVAESERSTFYTRHGRTVRDGGGIEADFKVKAEKVYPLEATLIQSGVMSDFAAQWSRMHNFDSQKQPFEVDDATYEAFCDFVQAQQRDGKISLTTPYSGPLEDLANRLSEENDNHAGTQRLLASLQKELQREEESNLRTIFRSDLKLDVRQSILSRYLPESMLIQRGLVGDPQVEAAKQLVKRQDDAFDTLLGRRGGEWPDEQQDEIPAMTTASSSSSSSIPLSSIAAVGSSSGPKDDTTAYC